MGRWSFPGTNSALKQVRGRGLTCLYTNRLYPVIIWSEHSVVSELSQIFTIMWKEISQNVEEQPKTQRGPGAAVHSDGSLISVTIDDESSHRYSQMSHRLSWNVFGDFTSAEQWLARNMDTTGFSPRQRSQSVLKAAVYTYLFKKKSFLHICLNFCYVVRV